MLDCCPDWLKWITELILNKTDGWYPETKIISGHLNFLQWGLRNVFRSQSLWSEAQDPDLQFLSAALDRRPVDAAERRANGDVGESLRHGLALPPLALGDGAPSDAALAKHWGRERHRGHIPLFKVAHEAAFNRWNHGGIMIRWAPWTQTSGILTSAE